MAAVSLRGRKPEEEGSDAEEKMVSWRASAPVRRYIAKEKAETRRPVARIIDQALELDRDLGEKLDPEIDRMTAYAAAHGLSMETELAEVLARLVRAGLDASDARPEKKPKK